MRVGIVPTYLKFIVLRFPWVDTSRRVLAQRMGRLVRGFPGAINETLDPWLK